MDNVPSDVRERFEQYSVPIRDNSDERWVICVECGNIAPASVFCIYGGAGTVNSGVCNKCKGKHFEKHKAFTGSEGELLY